MIKTLMPKDFKPGDYFEFPRHDTWIKVSHVTEYNDGSVIVWTTDTDDGVDVCPFSWDDGPLLVRRPEH